MHGDGKIFGTMLAQVEIKRQDCHGKPDMYPWELRIGYSEEFHNDALECYACHTSWVPQCYGCHVQVIVRPEITPDFSPQRR